MTTRRKLESGVFVFTVFSTLLIIPPLVYIFNQPLLFFGLPQIVLYLFAVWALLVIGTALLTRRLPRAADEDGHEGDE
ncbi:hypothetical protein [Devosia sp. XK-2]|jgi:hypothetical protein|uniref:hypothetical protein n=1 Tax=Devosia sp. XK-2 TaxID=3126689 RepID=UPI0030D3680B